MSSEFKPYNSTANDIFDRPAKIMAVRFLHNRGYRLTVPLFDQPQMYGHSDFYIKNPNGKIECFEVAVKDGWDGHGEWMGFATFHFEKRKANTRSDIYIQFNRHYDTFLMCPVPIIKEVIRTRGEKAITYVSGTVRSTGEKFTNDPMYNVACYHNATFYTIWQNINWREITVDGKIIK